MSEKNWRDHKMPQWVKDQIADEMMASRIKTALAWPNEARPEPLPFRWGDYDRVYGEPIPGSYWRILGHRHAFPVHIRHRVDGDKSTTWKKWMFSNDGIRWSDSVQRGDLYVTKREALLALLWAECEKSAAVLSGIINQMENLK